MNKVLLLLFLIPIVMTSCRHKTIPMIGMDDNGNEVIEQVSAMNFRTQSAEVMNLVAKDTLETLSGTQYENGWTLDEFQVGLLVNATVGPLAWKVGATPGFRLVFKRVAK